MLPYYARPGPLTQSDKPLVDLPRDVALLCSIIHGMMLPSRILHEPCPV
jgi:hypothetical protein